MHGDAGRMKSSELVLDEFHFVNTVRHKTQKLKRFIPDCFIPVRHAGRNQQKHVFFDPPHLVLLFLCFGVVKTSEKGEKVETPIIDLAEKAMVKLVHLVFGAGEPL